MMIGPLLDNSAQWLNAHAVAVTLVLAVLALLIERLRRIGGLLCDLF